MELDAAMSEDIFLKEELAGTTAVVTLIKENILYCVSLPFILMFRWAFLYNLKFFLNIG